MGRTADGVRVLYVARESALAETVAALLEQTEERVRVETATSASEVLARLGDAGRESGDAAVDCVVSAYDLPDDDGVSLCERLRDGHARTSLPVLIYTDAGSEAVASRAFSAGVTDYIRHGEESHERLASAIIEHVEKVRRGRRADATDRRLREMAERTGDVLWTVTADWEEVLFVNGAVEDVFGISPAALSAAPERFLQVTHPDDRPKVLRGMERLAAGHAVDIEYRAEGDRQRWVWLRAEPVVEGGAVDRIVGFARDITDRKAREDRLRQTTARLQALFEASPDTIAVHDSDGTVLDPNRRLCAATGYDRETLTGMALWELLPERDPETAREQWAEMDAGDRHRVETEYQRADGSTFPVEIHRQRLSLRGADRFVAIGRDITDQQAREAELRAQNERLDEFASIVSHDLRNPLNVATLRLEQLQTETDSEHLDALADALDRMDGLIEDLLTLARTGESTGRKRVSLARTCEACWGVIDTGDATLVTDTDRAVWADEGRLRQLLENLFRNAIEHGSTSLDSQARRDAAEQVPETPIPEAEQTVAEYVADAREGGESPQSGDAARADPPTDDAVTVTVGTLSDGFYVEDDGPGIPASAREQVFESGYTSAEDGTGLGLNIVKRIVEDHGWAIRAVEGRDGGARFEVTGVEFA
jgi:PAS domain S-box-containing protein